MGHKSRVFCVKAHHRHNSIFLSGGWDNVVKVRPCKWDVVKRRSNLGITGTRFRFLKYFRCRCGTFETELDPSVTYTVRTFVETQLTFE